MDGKNPVDNADPNGSNVATKKKEDGDDAMLVLTMAMKTMVQLLMLTLCAGANELADVAHGEFGQEDQEDEMVVLLVLPNQGEYHYRHRKHWHPPYHHHLRSTMNIGNVQTKSL